MAPKSQTGKPGAAIAVAAPATLSTQVVVPDFLQQHLGHQDGLEEADKDDFVLPRLAICQSLSPQRKRSSPAYVEGLQEGDLFNTVTGKVYARVGEPLDLIPLFLTKQRIKFKEPIGSGIDCQSLNGKTGGHYSPESCRACQFSSWKDGDSPECTDFRNLVCLVRGDQSPVVFSNKSTMMKTIKQWLSQIKLSNLPMFAAVYTIKTETEVKNNNEYFTYSQTRKEFVDAETFGKAKAFFDSLHDKSIAFNPEDLDEADAGHADGDAF